MTSSKPPVGACGDAAPTGDHVLNAVAHARGVLQVEAETLRRERNDAISALEVVLKAIAGAHELLRMVADQDDLFEIDTACHLARRELNHLKDTP